jgi:hypothetical protein
MTVSSTMAYSERLKIYQAAKMHFGHDSQMQAAGEEFIEAGLAIFRFLNPKKGRPLAEVFSELADAEIMCEQMRLYFDVEEIDKIKADKLRELKQKIDREKMDTPK